jgi:hypothetical protein
MSLFKIEIKIKLKVYLIFIDRYLIDIDMKLYMKLCMKIFMNLI